MRTYREIWSFWRGVRDSREETERLEENGVGEWELFPGESDVALAVSLAESAAAAPLLK